MRAESDTGTRDSSRGSIVLCSGAGERLGMIAGTQVETVFLSGEELVAHLPTLEDGVRAAIELAAWDRSLAGPSTQTRTVVVSAGDGRQVAAALDRGRSLLAHAPPGRACLETAADPHPPIDWVGDPGGADGLACLQWAGTGREPGAGSEPSAETSPARTTPMIGRRAELEELANAWADAERGSTRMVLVAGQPGSGKTRLVSEAAAEIEQAGGAVLYGAGEESEVAPYAPFVAALANAAPREGRPSPTFNDLARGAEPARGKPASAGLGVEPSALFNAAVGELEHRCRHSPTALIIEDLHNCAPSSLQLLNHLARSPDLKRLLIVGSYRPTDLDPESPQAALVGELRRQARATHLELGPLDVRALQGLAASLGVERSILREAAEVAAEETAGLPLYAGELLRAIAADGRIESAAEIPRSLQLLIESRIRALGSGVHEHLSAGAVAGTSFDARVVAAAAEIDPEELAESLRRAERAGVLVARPSAGEHAFGHALTRRCLYEALSGAHRGQLHRRLALAMEREAADGASIEPGRIARHWEQAEPADRSRAAEWAARAAERALERFDPAAAVGWYERALELEGRGQRDDARRCDLLLGLGAALRLEGSARFREVLLEAARLALELDDPARLASAVLTNDRGFISAVGDFDRERLALLELATDRVEDETLRPLLLAQLALELTFAPERERRHGLAEEALRLARAADEEAVLARVLNRYLLASWEPGNARTRIKIADESVKVGARLDGPLDLFHGLHWRAVAQLEVCEIEGAHRSINEELRIAARLGDPTADWLSACSVALRHTLLGRLEEAETEAERAAALGQASGQPDALAFYASQIASIRWQQGRLGELTPLLDAAHEYNPGLPGFRALVALARVAAGNADGAREVLEIDSADGFEKLPRDPIWLSSAVNYAHVAAELGERSAAESLSDQLQPLLGRIATSSVGFWGLTDHAVGRLQATLGRLDEAILLLERSIREYTRFPSPIWRGQAMLELAAVLREANRDEARQGQLVAEARALGLRHGAGLLSGDGEEDAAAGAAGRPDPQERLEALDLTDRQRDVVVLIARGMSNAEIAEELAISPRTVKRHLENAFARTGVRGRKGLMALLYE